jgi:hypothetical protein
MNSVALKRRHNFVDESYQHQSKIYVTERILFSRSSEQTEQKTTIHSMHFSYYLSWHMLLKLFNSSEKTLDMLYLGAKKQQGSTESVLDKQCWTCPHFAQPSDGRDKKYKQMQINASGQLITPQYNVS